MDEQKRPRLVGLNHIALEVADVEEALRWYGQVFAFELRGRGQGMAFIELGDQFIALQEGRKQPKDDGRHFGLVVDDRAHVRDLLEAAGAEFVEGPFLDFRDPWGNRVEVVEYKDIQFTKADHVLEGMGLQLTKSDKARAELEAKGMTPP